MNMDGCPKHPAAEEWLDRGRNVLRCQVCNEITGPGLSQEEGE